MPKVQKEYTVTQASRTYDAHTVTLARLCLMGRLKAHKNADGHWLISEESLEQWHRNRQRLSRASNRLEKNQEVAASA